jgi:nucleotide-binding universal stress UspA family protein
VCWQRSLHRLSPIALAFLAGLILLLVATYYLRPPLGAIVARRAAAAEGACDRLLVAVANPRTAEGLALLAANLSEQRPGSPVEILAVIPTDREHVPMAVERMTSRHSRQQDALLRRVSDVLQGRNVPFFTQLHMARGVAEGIMDEITLRGDVRLLLMGWPGPLSPQDVEEHPVAMLLREAKLDMAVFLDRGIIERPRRILVPFGGGIHSCLALRLARQIVEPRRGEVVALRFFLKTEGEVGKAMLLDDDTMVDVALEDTPIEDAEMHDEMMLTCETIEAELGEVPANVSVKVVSESDIKEGLLRELGGQQYDLVVMGAALAHHLEPDLFGSLTDAVAEVLPISVLLVRRYEPRTVNWMRRQVKEIVEPEAEVGAEPSRNQ